MADPSTQEWPNEGPKIVATTWTLVVLSTIFVIWRVVYGIIQKRSFMVCDYLLIIATCLNIAATSTNTVVVYAALGRHIMDPSVAPGIMTYSYYLWITQILNIMAVAILKYSICAWLLVLNFSKLYQVIIWLSIAMVTAVGLLAPVLTLFGCTPLEKNWNFGFRGEFHCWARGTLPLSYTQGISNIITDLVYMAAPLIYLRRVQLAKRTQWGIRAVFLLSIPATICSIFKTIELRTIIKTQDPSWDGTNLAIWSGAELSTGILIASLPPLRKAFDNLFRKVLPSSFTNSGKTPQYGYGVSASGANNIHMKNFQGSKAYHSRIPGESVLDGDDESDRAILEDEEHKGPGIMKSTAVNVTLSEVEDGGSSSKAESPNTYNPSIDWASPHLEKNGGAH
ncbi:hypothetical protein BDW02DRAFT_181833 [Decorospora gaudefroyi]|uniref:Rhodopsin domain-containing protein n=1 Tax=Decorospora gaudefroyi TaxID=184978 RepID=A0A6A5KJ18_9PLEO|nr:hypothetical protein BDW02DRAFT_181833 [Decorospora gaudefroyi]